MAKQLQARNLDRQNVKLVAIPAETAVIARLPASLPVQPVTPPVVCV